MHICPSHFRRHKYEEEEEVVRRHRDASTFCLDHLNALCLKFSLAQSRLAQSRFQNFETTSLSLKYQFKMYPSVYGMAWDQRDQIGRFCELFCRQNFLQK